MSHHHLAQLPPLSLLFLTFLLVAHRTKKPFDPPPNSKKPRPPKSRRTKNGDDAAAAEAEEAEEQETVPSQPLDQKIRARQLQVTPPDEESTASEWYRPNPCAESLSGHCDNYIEAISYYTFVENSNGVKSVLARCGREVRLPLHRTLFCFAILRCLQRTL